MNTFSKTSLLASVSTLAILTATFTPAQAFDTVNWTWDAAITETVTKNVLIDINLTPAGMVMVEDLQVSIGDIQARSSVRGVENQQPSSGGEVDLGTQDVTFHYGLGGGLLDDGFQSPSVVAANVDEVDQQPDINGTVTVTLDLGTVDVPATDSYDAVTELPSVVSAATAVANNSSITSDAALQLHEGQFVFNVSGEGSTEVPFVGTDNTNVSAAATLALLALNGSIDKADISARSRVSDILNASVDSSATAVANNLTVNLTPAAGNSLMIGDITQFSLADVSASSRVRDVTLVNYTGLGNLAGPVVSSVATAVGNNKSINVSAPVVVATP